MPVSRNRDIKKKTKVRFYPSASVQKDLNKLTVKESIITTLCIMSMLCMAGSLVYFCIQDKKNQKEITVSEIEAARQKIQNLNTVNFMDAVHQHTR